MSALGQDYVTLPGAAGAPTMHRALRLLTGLSGLLLLAATGWLLSPRLAWLSSSFATSHDDSHHAGAAQNDAAKHLTGWQAAGVGAPGPLQQMPTPTKTDLYATPKQQHDVLFKFGLIADIQYADSEDAFNFDGSKRRFYRSALNSVRAGVRAWNEEPGGIAFVGQLGDIIDGKNNHPLKQSHSAVRTVTRLLEQIWYAMLCYAMLCYAMLCYAMLCYMLYATCYMLYAICYMLCSMLYAICSMLYAICYMLYAICYMLCYMLYAICYAMQCDMRYAICDVLYTKLC
eukprot:g12296.t1